LRLPQGIALRLPSHGVAQLRINWLQVLLNRPNSLRYYEKMPPEVGSTPRDPTRKTRRDHVHCVVLAAPLYRAFF
jgi:hypothetical protein